MECVLCSQPVSVVGPEVYDLRFGVPGRYQIARCGSCGVEQTLPRLSDVELIDTYERYYNFRSDDEATYTRRRSAVVRSGLYRWWLRLDGDISFVLQPGQGRRLLDVGCNEGRNLELFAQSGFRAEGIEPNPAAWEATRRLGLTAHLGDLGDLAVDEPFDVIVMSNVLEHVQDPALALTQARARLRPGGEIWISCPNAQSWLRRRFGAAWINWHPPFHLVHFTEDSLVSLLDRQGFDVVEQRTLTPALWLVQSILARRFAKPGQATLQLRQPVLVAPALLACRGLFGPVLWLADRRHRGDCLMVRARRPA
ncbi:MAG: class I SAM-dependent methyltransferase [Acidimicrobiales bacterium]